MVEAFKTNVQERALFQTVPLKTKNGQIRNLPDLPGLVDLTGRLSNSVKQLCVVIQEVMAA